MTILLVALVALGTAVVVAVIWRRERRRRETAKKQMERLSKAMAELERTFGDAVYPAVYRANKAFAEFNRVWGRH